MVPSPSFGWKRQPRVRVGVGMPQEKGLCCKDDRRRWEDGDKLDPISFMRRYRKER
jgi:hypothetical protein